MMLKAMFSLLSPEGEGGRLSTLIFHRVLPETDPLFPGEPDIRRFDQILGWVARWLRVLPLDQAVERLRAGTLPARAAAITFDDGYADNHQLALPILAKHGLCATFFVATGFLDGGRMWNDTVIESVRSCLASTLDLTNLANGTLGIFDLSGIAQRRLAIDTILRAIKYLPPDERNAVAQRVCALTGAQPSDDLMMTSEQVRALRRAGMQVGAHTVSHPILAGLSDSAARVEMLQSKQRLEHVLNEPVTLFAYPNGRPDRDFTRRSVQLARDVGFKAAVSTEKGVAHARTDPFCIPRYTPWERSRLRFGARLAANLLTTSLGPTRG